MELWIRSQDKADLVCTKRIYAYENTIRTNVYETIGFTILGEYATKERALEILNEIQKLITPQIIMKEMKTTGLIENGMSDGTLYIKNEPHIEMVSPVIYEMPKE